MALDDGMRGAAPAVSGRVTALVVLLIGGLGVPPAALSSAVGMLREQLHFACTYGTQGEAAGSWWCADGIGYLLPGVGLVAFAGLPVLIALVVAIFAPRARTAFTVLAFVPMALLAAVLCGFTAFRTDALPAGETWPGIWWASAGIAGLLALLGTVALVLPLPRIPHIPRIAAIVAGVGLLLAALILQPGLACAIIATGANLAARALLAERATVSA